MKYQLSASLHKAVSNGRIPTTGLRFDKSPEKSCHELFEVSSILSQLRSGCTASASCTRSGRLCGFFVDCKVWGLEMGKD